LGASTSAIVSFYLGRYLLRDWVTGLAHKYAIFEALDAALQDKGFVSWPCSDSDYPL
jgi:uncharacterized membrane protein YdjX (TVP38/TMEM64 family)